MRLTNAAMMGLLLGSALLVTACASAPPKRMIDGYAVIECTLTAEGKPIGCLVVEENPTGRGIGAEGLAAVSRGHLSPNSERAGSQFRVRVQATIEAEDPASSPEDRNHD